MAKTIAEVERKPNETTASALRRFTKKIQGGGIVRAVRSKRYQTREKSEFKKKKDALNKIEKRAHYKKLYKLGKVVERRRGRRR